MLLLALTAFVPSTVAALRALWSPARSLRPAPHSRVSHAALAMSDNTDDNDYEGLDDGDEPFIEDIDARDVEDMLFCFTPDGTAKPWAVKPHLRSMAEEVGAGTAVLLDVRGDAQWTKGHLSLATHCPLALLELGQLVPPLPLPSSKATPIFTHSGFSDEGKEGVKAAMVLRGMGYSNARHLVEPFEALRAQLEL
ncbi:hypothetical protein T492DRAFT_832199 [Pavlovales sp. CCMP2436]|nr:hypothetical protein T492DRAFT_832199 [Pavlovales sp. CCMP2436]